MQFTQAIKSYNNPKAEGWVVTGEIFNVGKEHRPGLRTITVLRAKQLVDARLHVEYRDGDARMSPGDNDPVATKLRVQSAAQGQQQRQDNRRQTKVDPPPQTKAPTRQPRNPPTPRRAADVTRQSEAPTQTRQTSTAGGPTGQAQPSQSSSPVDPAAKPSTGKRRGMRRGDPAAQKRAGLRSTKAGDSSPTETRSTAPTATGGNTGSESSSSQD